MDPYLGGLGQGCSTELSLLMTPDGASSCSEVESLSAF